MYRRKRNLIQPLAGNVFALIFSWVTCFGQAPNIDKYILRGVVTSVICDEAGNPISGEIAPGTPATTVCQFIWYRSGDRWRLDFKEPAFPFKEGVWKSIMPFTDNELISIVSCPPMPDNPKAGGNAIVRVLTNKLVVAENIYGAHAVWLGFNLDQIITLLKPSNKCPPFWVYDPAIQNLSLNFHEVIRTNGSVFFRNPGRYFEKDGNQMLVYEAGQPKQLMYPAPADEGFIEAQYQMSDEFVDQHQQIHKRAEFTYWTPFRDESNPNGMRLVLTSKLIIECQSADFKQFPDSTFDPVWTNSFATVIDFRETLANGQPLTYITKAKTITPSRDDLQKRKKFSEKMQAVASTKQDNIPSPKQFPRILFIITFCTLTLALWWAFGKSKKAGEFQ